MQRADFELEKTLMWERLKVRGEGDNRGWDGWMASPTRWTWIWINSGSWWWTGRPGVLQSMGPQRVGHDWETELNWTFDLWRLCSLPRSCSVWMHQARWTQAGILHHLSPLCKPPATSSGSTVLTISLESNPIFRPSLLPPSASHLAGFPPFTFVSLVLIYQAVAGVNIFKLGN